MAGDWIKFEKSTLEKPEVYELAEMLDIDPDAVVGKLLRVWNWFDDQSVDGNALVTVRALLDRYSGVSGFTKSMEAVGWLVVDGNTMSLPNFERHNGQTAKNRALTSKRVSKNRSKCNAKGNAKGNADSVTLSLPEKRREEKSNIPLTPKGGSRSEVLDLLHCRVVRCITPNSKCDRPRDAKETQAWKKAKSHITAADVAVVEAFYRLPKAKDCDQTWNRKTGVTQLINQWTDQVEMAEALATAEPELSTVGGFRSV